MSMEPDMFSDQGAIGKNSICIKASTVKSSETAKQKRKYLRATAKGYTENEKKGSKWL